MKTNLLLFAMCSLLAACGSEPKTSNNSEPTIRQDAVTELTSDSTSAASPSAMPQQPPMDTIAATTEHNPTEDAVAAGAKLIVSSDCTGCHKEQEKLVGPSYAAVAEKYPLSDANITLLANKIIQGGKGNWGEVPMMAHSSLSVADAKQMAEYILRIK